MREESLKLPPMGSRLTPKGSIQCVLVSDGEAVPAEQYKGHGHLDYSSSIVSFYKKYTAKFRGPPSVLPKY